MQGVDMKYRSLYLLLPLLVISFYTIRASEEASIARLDGIQEALDDGQIFPKLALVIANNQHDFTEIPTRSKQHRREAKQTQWTTDSRLRCPATLYRPATTIRKKALPVALRSKIEGYANVRAEKEEEETYQAIRSRDTNLLFDQFMETNEQITNQVSLSFIGDNLLETENKALQKLTPRVHLEVAALQRRCRDLEKASGRLGEIDTTLDSQRLPTDVTFYLDTLKRLYYQIGGEKASQDKTSQQAIRELFIGKELLLSSKYGNEREVPLDIYVDLATKTGKSWYFNYGRPEDACRLLEIEGELNNIEQKRKEIEAVKTLNTLNEKKDLAMQKQKLQDKQNELLGDIKQKVLTSIKVNSAEYTHGLNLKPFSSDLRTEKENLESLIKSEAEGIKWMQRDIAHMLLYMIDKKSGKISTEKAIQELFVKIDKDMARMLAQTIDMMAEHMES